MKDLSKSINKSEQSSLPVIQTEKALRKIIPSYPKMLDKRIKHSLDQFSTEFIDLAKVAIVATSAKHGSMFILHCRIDGLSILDEQHFVLQNISASYLSQDEVYPLNASLYFLIPGVGHSLRINGTIEPNKDRCYLFSITQVYFHCARAAVRAALWNTKLKSNLSIDNFISNAPYLLLKTRNIEGKTEVSPRGGKLGFVKQISKTSLLIPESPGNKVAVSLRNIISCSEVELLFLAPGVNQTFNVKGVAKVISSCDLLEQCVVNGKVPKMGILIEVQSSKLQIDPVLDIENIWGVRELVKEISITPFSKALSAHINGTGLLGKATATIVGAVVKHDMKNLY